ncbi:MAG: hypothetical protein P8K08_22220 [Fuerstiella sp.]|nr:hypothetical protein [Fuerstiella sp.]
MTNPLQELNENFAQARVIAKAIYALMATHCFLSLRDWGLWFVEGGINFQPVWAVSWLNIEHVASFWMVITLCGLGTSLLVTFQTESRSFRIVAAVCLVLHFAIEDSRDSIRHGEHGLLWAALILAWLPDITRHGHFGRRTQHAYLRVFGTAQFMLLLFYFMAGAVKLLTSCAQGARGERTLLHPDSGALIIAEWLLRGDAPSLMGRWFVQHRFISWFGLLGSVALELLAITPFFWRPAQPVIAIGLIGMHVAIGLSMDVWFPENVALLSVLILAGPPLAMRR